MGRVGLNLNCGYEVFFIGWNVCREIVVVFWFCFRWCCGVFGVDVLYDEIEIVYFGNMNMGVEFVLRM